MSDAPKRKFGFPLLMFLGFCLGAIVGVGIALVLSQQRGTFSYVSLFNLVAPLGGLGAYGGHVLGAYRNKDSGIEPFGPITPGILLTGGIIVLLGSALVMGAMIAIMTAVKGHGPPH